MKILRLLPLLFLLSDACVERLELPVVTAAPRIVVDGLLTNRFGMHSVKLFMTANLNSKLNEGAPITNAVVKIVDEHETEFSLLHTGKGVYSIENFQGVTNRMYKLKFGTSDGKEYESTFQRLQPGGEITAIAYEFLENVINKDDLAADHDVFRFYIDSKNQDGSPGLFRWRWSSIFEALTFPELRKIPIAGSDPPAYAADPIPCSGWVTNADGVTMSQISLCECCQCWVTEYSQKAMTSNNQVATRPVFKKVQVAQVPVDWKKFQSKFYISVEQLNLSDEVYQFWKNVEAQQSGTGSIFQPNIIRITGNVRCVSDPEEEVSGIFSVAGSTSRELFIKRIDVPKILRADTIVNDCRKAYPGSTTKKPLFW